MKNLTESERAYRRGCLQTLEFILADFPYEDSKVLPYLSTWLKALRYARNSNDFQFLGTYLDSVREVVNSTNSVEHTHDH